MNSEQLKGKPDGTYIFRDSDGNEHEGWMPPEILTAMLEQSGSQKLTPVVIREPNDEIREDFWPVDSDTVQRFADTEGKVHVVSHLENGQPQYNFVSKRVWNSFDQMTEIMMNPSLSDGQKRCEIQRIMSPPPNQ